MALTMLLVINLGVALASMIKGLVLSIKGTLTKLKALLLKVKQKLSALISS